MLKTITANLIVKSVQDTVAWYRDVLGFESTVEVPGDDGAPQFAIVRRDSVQLMFSSSATITDEFPELQRMPIGASQTFYIEVDGIAELRSAVAGKVRILKDMHETFYGTREFYFTDCNGYVLSFSEELSTAAGA